MNVRMHLETLRQGARLLVDLPKMLPRAKTSPGRVLQERAKRRPHEVALLFEHQRYSWCDVNAKANQYAAWFADAGIGATDVVALMMDNRPHYLFAVMGLSKLGAVAALINTNLTGSALAHAFEVSGARRILLGAEHLEAGLAAVESTEARDLSDLLVQAEGLGEEAASSISGVFCLNSEVARASTSNWSPQRPPSNSDTFCYIYTSGTTGLPKAAIIKNQRMLGAGAVFGRLMHQCGPGQVVYIPLPLYHSNALFLGWGSVLMTGAAAALRRRFSASKFLDDVRRYQASSFIYIGELCRYLLNTPERSDDHLNPLVSAVGNGMRPDIWERFQTRFGVSIVREFYGSTEGNAATVNLTGRPGMIGWLPFGQVVVRCDPATGALHQNARGFCEPAKPGEVGLLLGRLSKLVSYDGYIDRKASDAKIVCDVFKDGDRYYNTGDLVALHRGRWLSFVDRLGDTFRWKGENVSTNQVAEVLNTARGVLEANVYGVQVPHTEGRVGMAALRVDGGFELAQFATHVRDRLPAYQRPLFLRVLSGDMQLTATLKQRKGDYRDEGFDMTRVKDPVFVLLEHVYRPLNTEILTELASGQVVF